jgi:hypothetical protein
MRARLSAWLAFEPAEQPWPPIQEKDGSAGPFYIVWTGAEVGSIRSEQWPYQVAKLVSQLAGYALACARGRFSAAAN